MATYIMGHLARGQVVKEEGKPKPLEGQFYPSTLPIEEYTKQYADVADNALWIEEEIKGIPGIISADEIKGLNEQGIHIWKAKTLRRHLYDQNLLGKDWARGIPKRGHPAGTLNTKSKSFQNSYYIITDTQFNTSTMSSPGLLIFIDRDKNDHLAMGKTIMQTMSAGIQKGTLPGITRAIKQAIQPLQAAEVSAGLGTAKGRNTKTDNDVLTAALGSISKAPPKVTAGVTAPHTGATATTQATTAKVKPQNFSQAQPKKGGRSHKKTRRAKKHSKKTRKH